MEKNNYFKKEVAEFCILALEKYFEDNKIPDCEKVLIIDNLIEESK